MNDRLFRISQTMQNNRHHGYHHHHHHHHQYAAAPGPRRPTVGTLRPRTTATTAILPATTMLLITHRPHHHHHPAAPPAYGGGYVASVSVGAVPPSHNVKVYVENCSYPISSEVLDQIFSRVAHPSRLTVAHLANNTGNRCFRRAAAHSVPS